MVMTGRQGGKICEDSNETDEERSVFVQILDSCVPLCQHLPVYDTFSLYIWVKLWMKLHPNLSAISINLIRLTS